MPRENCETGVQSEVCPIFFRPGTRETLVNDVSDIGFAIDKTEGDYKTPGKFVVCAAAKPFDA